MCGRMTCDNVYKYIRLGTCSSLQYFSKTRMLQKKQTHNKRSQGTLKLFVISSTNIEKSSQTAYRIPTCHHLNAGLCLPVSYICSFKVFTSCNIITVCVYMSNVWGLLAYAYLFYTVFVPLRASRIPLITCGRVIAVQYTVMPVG